MNRGWFAALFFVVVTGVFAQEATRSRPIPQPPFVTDPPLGSQWRAVIETAGLMKTDVRPSVVPVGLQMQVGRNQMQRGVIAFSDGSQKVFYIVDNLILQNYDNSAKVAVTSVESEGMFALRQKGWPGVFWLSSGNYSGVEFINNIECCYFQMSGMDGSELPEAFPFNAWIRKDSGYPRRIQTGDLTFEFSEVTVFPQDILLPQAYQAALEEVKARLRVLERLKAGLR